MRYRKRIPIAKGLHLNLSKSGIGLGLQLFPGLSISMNKDGIYRSTSLPGTGLYDRQRIASLSGDPETHDTSTAKSQYEIEASIDDNGAITTVVTLNGEEVVDETIIRKIMRSDAYKNAVTNLQYQLKDKIDKRSSDFINVFKHTEHPVLESTMKSRRNKLKLELLSPEPFVEVEPSYDSVRLHLEEKAKNEISSFLFWTNKKKREEFVANNLSDEYQRQHDEWSMRKKDFEESELERVQKLNDELSSQYNQQMDAIRIWMEGTDDEVSSQFENSLSTISLPCEFSIDFDIDTANGLAKIDLDLPEIEDIPAKKANILASGKVSVKEKTCKEVAEDYSTCVLGLAFYFSGMLFNISSKINIIEVAGYTQRISGKTGNVEDQYIYAVRFDRERFREMNFHHIIPIEAINDFPHVCHLDSKGLLKTISPVIDN